MRAFESLGDMFSSIVENLRSPGKQKFDPVPRWSGGRIKIARKSSDVYAFWRSSSNLPKVFRVIQSLTLHEGGVTHWVLRGHAGQALAFHCEQVVEDIGRRIEWRATKDSPVHSSLAVSFHALEDERTELVVEWTVGLKPDQAADVPLTLDGLLDEMTQRMLDDDLDRLRIVLELEVLRLQAEAEAQEEADAAAEHESEPAETQEEAHEHED